MILISELKGYDVEYRTGDKIGTVNDVLVDTTQDKWPIVGLMISPGFGKKNIMVTPSDEVVINLEEEEKIVVTGKAKLEVPITDASKMKQLSLDFIDKLPVVTQDGEKLGKIYDAVIMPRVTPWKVWKVLVKVPGLKSRRLRMDVRDIQRVTDEAIELNLSMAEIEEIEDEAEVEL